MIFRIKWFMPPISVAISALYPRKWERNKRVPITIMNINDKPASKMVRAISFWVFGLVAFCIKPTIWSRKLLPASELISTINLSLATFVPPITWSPLSLKTGLDSPVIIDSSTNALPALTRPSLGIISPEYTLTSSPGLRLLEVTVISLSSFTILWADTSLSRHYE